MLVSTPVGGFVAAAGVAMTWLPAAVATAIAAASALGGKESGRADGGALVVRGGRLRWRRATAVWVGEVFGEGVRGGGCAHTCAPAGDRGDDEGQGHRIA